MLTFHKVNAQEGVLIYIEPPGKDTLVDEVVINGKLINSTGKKLKFFKFYGTCKENDTEWKIKIRKDSIKLDKFNFVSRDMEAADILAKDSIYQFQFCINIHNLYN